MVVESNNRIAGGAARLLSRLLSNYYPCLPAAQPTHPHRYAAQALTHLVASRSQAHTSRRQAACSKTVKLGI